MAVSSDCPPDKKTIPGTAAGTDRFRHVTVLSATSSIPACFVHSEPDITMFGKAFGGGFPIGAIGGKDEFMQILDNSSDTGELNQSGTFSGNSFTLAAGLATLNGLTTEVYDHIDSLRQILHDGLVQVFEKASLPNRVLSAGAGLQYYLTDQPITDYRAVQSLPNSELVERIELALFLKGFSMRGGIGITLSAPMTSDHITDFLSALEETLQEK